MATFAQVIAQVRDALDETSPAQWQDVQLRRWINRGLVDIARVTRHIRDRATISTVSGTAEYTVAANVLEIESAYFLPGDGRYIPLTARQWEAMDAVWGTQQNQTGGYPELFTVWGYSPNLKLRLYPAPSTTGTNNVSLMVVRTPTLLSETGAQDSTALDMPEAWTDALVHYCEYCALRKDRDPRWQEAYTLYQEVRDQLVVMGDYLNAPREIIMDPYAGPVDRWIADPNW